MKLADKPINARSASEYELNPPEGMTLREHYAGLAMQALIGDADSKANISRLSRERNIDADVGLAKAAIEFADALIAELEKRGKQYE